MTALILCGGGSRGAVEVGLYRALVELGIRFDLVVGASVGAINGAAIAGGMSPFDLAATWRALRAGDVFRVNRRLLTRLLWADSLYDHRPLRRFLERRLPVRTFAALKTPLIVTATNFETGEPVTLRQGDLINGEAADDHLMGRVRAGDLRAFGDLYERYRTPVFTFLVRLTGHRQLAEDLLQETFLRVYRARRDYRASGHFRAWLFTIARRLVVDHYRRERIDWERQPEALEAVAAPGMAEQQAESRELLGRVERALNDLPPAQRELILLSRVVGMDADEIAHVIGSTPGAVRVAIHRILRRLRSLTQ